MGELSSGKVGSTTRKANETPGTLLFSVMTCFLITLRHSFPVMSFDTFYESTSFHGTRCIQPCVLGCKQISVRLADCGGLLVIDKCLMLLFCVLTALPAFSAQHVALHPRPGLRFRRTGESFARSSTWSVNARKPASAAMQTSPCAPSPTTTLPSPRSAQVTTKQETISARRSGQLRYEVHERHRHGGPPLWRYCSRYRPR